MFAAGTRRMSDNGAMNEDQLTPGGPADEQPEQEPQGEARQPSSSAQDPRRRLRELLAVPERDRSDAVWDEIIELEIQLAPGNRATSQQPHGMRHPEAGRTQDARRQGALPQQERAFGGKPGKRFSKQPKHRPGRRSRPAG